MVELANGWKLRLRQEECHNRLKESYKKGEKEFLIAAVCRFGKTITTLQSLRDLAAETGNTSQAIIVLCTMNVKGEWRDAAEKTGFDPQYCETPVNDIDFGKIGESGRHVIYVSTQKLGNQSEQSDALIKWFNRHEGLKTLVYDECHLGSGTDRTQREIIDRLDFDNKVYLSGTPYRSHLKNEFQFEKQVGQDICYTYSMTDEREDYKKGVITDYTPVQLNMMVLDYQKEIEEVAGKDIDKFTQVYGVSSKYFKKLFSEKSMREQAIEFLQKIVQFAKEKKVNNGIFFVPIRKVGQDIVKDFAKIFQNSIEFRSLCDNYPDDISLEEAEALSESEAAALNVFFDAPNPTNKVRIGITCNKCGTGTTLKNLDFAAFLKETSNAISFIQQSQRVRTPKEGKEEAYVLVFNQWSALKAFQDYARASYPTSESITDAIKAAYENGAIKMTLNLNKEMDYEYIIDLLSYYHPGETLFDDFDLDLYIDDFTFIIDIERCKEDLAKKNKSLRKDPDFQNASSLKALKAALKKSGHEKELEDVEMMEEVSKKDLKSLLTEAYVGQVMEMFADYDMTLETIKDYANYPEDVKASIEAGVCNMAMWEKLNTEYCTYFAKIYNYMKKENLLD